MNTSLYISKSTQSIVHSAKKNLIKEIMEVSKISESMAQNVFKYYLKNDNIQFMRSSFAYCPWHRDFLSYGNIMIIVNKIKSGIIKL